MSSAPLLEADRALRAGDSAGAWRSLRPLLIYPNGVEMTAADFAQSLGILALVGDDTLTKQVREALATAGANPTDVQALFTVGYLLNESGYPLVAATALGRANALAPNVAELVNQFAAALARAGLHADAYLALQASYVARQDNWHTRYAYSFNALMSGQLIEARQSFALLGPPIDETTEVLYDRMVTYFHRHSMVTAAGALAGDDLRGWHYVLTGGLLTHVSPHGLDQGMNGRYGSLQDSDVLLHESVIRAVATLEAWSMRPEQLIYSRDHSSEVLAQVWHKRIGIPIKEFTPGDVCAAGLFVAYDLGEAAPEFVGSMDVRRPDQLLLSHACCWTSEGAFTSDITTLLYETNVAPWGARAAMVAGTEQLEQSSPGLATSAEVLAERIVTTKVPPAAIVDLDRVTALAGSIGRPPMSGRREPFLIGSPVQSSRLA